MLLQHGADPNIRNTDGKSALDLADPSAKAVLTGQSLRSASYFTENTYESCRKVIILIVKMAVFRGEEVLMFDVKLNTKSRRKDWKFWKMDVFSRFLQIFARNTKYTKFWALTGVFISTQVNTRRTSSWKQQGEQSSETDVNVSPFTSDIFVTRKRFSELENLCFICPVDFVLFKSAGLDFKIE